MQPHSPTRTALQPYAPSMQPYAASMQPCVSRGRCTAVKLQIEQGCAAARAAQNERLAQALRPEGTGLFI